MLCSKILVAYDGSEPAKRALEKAVELAKEDNSIEIDVLHVVDSEPVLTDFSSQSFIKERLKEMTHGRLVLANAEKSLCSLINPCTTYLVEDSPEKAILNEVKRHNYDLIVMGSRGLSGIKELGSISHYVCQHSTIPVLIVK
jgi:nucleotide-binding universal stress UspA family protein